MQTCNTWIAAQASPRLAYINGIITLQMSGPTHNSLLLLYSFASYGICLLVAPSALAEPQTPVVIPRPSQGLQWRTSSSTVTAGRPLGWRTINPLAQLAADPVTPDPQAAEPAKPAQQSAWIVGVGAGARIGAGEPTYPMVYGRLGRKLDRTTSLSLRPRYIFGNSDLLGRSNSQGAFQMPLTLDVKATSWLTPYAGGGIATNTDSTGQTNGMLSLGADISLSRNLAIDLGVNYIIQPASIDSNGRDFEFNSVLYLRF